MPFANTLPTLTFHGPNTESQIKATNANGFEVARFMISGTRKEWSIAQLTSPTTPPIPICTAKISSLSGSCKMHVHGVELKLSDQLEGVVLETPTGTLKWKQESAFSSQVMKLIDKSKTVVAVASTKDDLKLEVMVQADEVFLDLLLAGWVAFVYKTQADREAGSAGLEVMGQILGAGA